jgi:hypothetical protein
MATWCSLAACGCLGALQAANGLMMFGITTALFIAAVQRATAKWTAPHRARVKDAS